MPALHKPDASDEQGIRADDETHARAFYRSAYGRYVTPIIDSYLQRQYPDPAQIKSDRAVKSAYRHNARCDHFDLDQLLLVLRGVRPERIDEGHLVINPPIAPSRDGEEVLLMQYVVLRRGRTYQTDELIGPLAREELADIVTGKRDAFIERFQTDVGRAAAVHDHSGLRLANWRPQGDPRNQG